MRLLGGNHHARLLCGTASIAILAAAAPAHAQEARNFDIPAQPLSAALDSFAAQSREPILVAPEITKGKATRGVNGSIETPMALAQLLEGTGLTYRLSGKTYLIVEADGPQDSGAAGTGAEVDALIVTAQKREEDIQDVPIAISAFTQEDLERSQIAGGPDLITQIPNFSFTKTNFSSYSIQIRGIGTQAVSATTDPAVAVAFNNTSLIRNRFFEQEFYDLERLEVLRGPQGTLYGRNATAGVVNIISAKPKFVYEAKASADVGNYNSTRIEGMVNIPLVEDVAALRLAGAWTKREGYATNQMTGQQIDGRDLWSTRVSLRLEPTDAISANLIWEHFEEDDDRLRSGKQLCKRHQPTQIGGIAIPSPTGSSAGTIANRYLSQGCERASFYSLEAFQTPNGLALPYFSPLGALGLPITDAADPYLSESQSRDLRVIESTVEPDYRAKTDIAELQVSIDLTDSFTLDSETAYSADSLFSFQDYNRFTTKPGVYRPNATKEGDPTVIVDADGFFCDPQLGCSDRLLLVDLSTSESTQFSQEFRLGSDFDGPANFSVGVNYLRHDAFDKYYVFINTLSLWTTFKDSQTRCPNRPGDRGETAQLGDPAGLHSIVCPYMDPNPVSSLNDMGRNYFLSKNPYKLISYAAFGEIYYNLTPDLKLTAGLRYTVDRKTAPQIPSWLLAAPEDGPYPTTQTIFQEWKEPTGRLAVDWKPVLGFTDETLVYASYAHGYKAGGANPPPPVFSSYGPIGAAEPLPDTFDPEFIDALEIGTKNTLLGGALVLNLTGFYYDYKGYQVSEIRNRSAVNSNYDAEVWGVEIEADWRPIENLKLSFKGGYEKTRIVDGETSIDLMDRTAGRPGWVVHRPFPSVPSNCILPEYVVVADGGIRSGNFTNGRTTYDGDCIDAYYRGVDPVTQLPYVENPQEMSRFGNAPVPLSTYGLTGYKGFNPLAPELNGGKGFSKQLGGNELPNAPDWTATISADYTVPLPKDWLMALHGDFHWQSDSWWRVFNDHEYNRLDEFYTINLAAIFTNEDAGWKVMAYVKNVLDEDAITGAFLNSDDSGLTTNVFLTEPRLYGVRVTKDFTGGLLGDLLDGAPRDPGSPYPLRVEVGAGVGRFDADTEIYGPWITSPLAASRAVQDEDIDWGDVRDVRLTYAPSNGWRVSAGYRFGRTNGDFRGAAYEEVPGGIVQEAYAQRNNHAITAVHDGEEYAVADFVVGKEVGLGLASSTLSAGLRYANFKSTSRVAMDGVTDSYIGPLVEKYTGLRRYNAHTTTLSSVREFEGLGPSLTWESSIRLVGDDQGHADLDWSVGGSVLFGKQSVESEEDRLGVYYRTVGWWDFTPPTTLYDEVVPRSRSGNVTVPNLSLTLGLSYEIDRVKVSTGYSYDRFFDAIDGGYKGAQSYDRTIQGPYLKLSVGFGG